MSKSYRDSYEETYLEPRMGDPRGEIMHRQQMKRLKNDRPEQGWVLGIGCGLSEFLSHFDGKWKKDGTDISEFANREANMMEIYARNVICDLIDYPDSHANQN